MGYLDGAAAASSANALLKLNALSANLKNEGKFRESRVISRKPLHLTREHAASIGRAATIDADQQAAFVAQRLASCRTETVPDGSASRLELSLRNTFDSRESWRRGEPQLPGVGAEPDWMGAAVEADSHQGVRRHAAASPPELTF